jgi:hypothetical protein
MKKILSSDRTAESCAFDCKTSCTFLFVGVTIALRSGVVRHKWDYASGTTVLTRGWETLQFVRFMRRLGAVFKVIG